MSDIDPQNGMVRHARVKPMRFSSLERGPLHQIKGIIVHQTDTVDEQGVFSSYSHANAHGAHFLIGKDGTIWQTASLNRRTHHVGPIKPRCLFEMRCSPAELKPLQRALNGPHAMTSHRLEMVKSVPVRYPSNAESVGIELVGKASLPANKPIPAGLNTTQSRIFCQRQRGVRACDVVPTTVVAVAGRLLASELPSACRRGTSPSCRELEESDGSEHGAVEVTRCFFSLLGVAFASCVLAPGSAFSADAADEPDYIARRLTPPPVVQVIVDVPSKRADLGQNADCSAFAVQARHVRFFLKHAKAVSERDYNNYYPWSECRASGTVRYANGMRANWHIESAGRGLLMPTNGKRKETLYFLYCEDCEGMGWSR